MKTKIRSLAAALMLACGLLTVTGCGGCKSASRTAYVTSGVSHVSVVAALHGWNDYLEAKDHELVALAFTEPVKAAAERQKVATQNVRVEDAYKKYQLSQEAVLFASQEFSNITPSDPAKPESADTLNKVVKASADALANLLAVLNEFGFTSTK